MKLFRISFPDILVAGDDKDEAKEYLSQELSSTSIYSDLCRYDINYVISEDEIPNTWDPISIPWGENTEEKGVTVGKLLNKITEGDKKDQFINELKELIEKYE